MEWMRYDAASTLEIDRVKSPIALDRVALDTPAHLAVAQSILSLPRETLPQITTEATREVLAGAGSRLELELLENELITPTFLLLPPGGGPPDVLLLGIWHGEGAPVTPAAVEGAERVALTALLGALDAIRSAGVSLAPALVIAPASQQGSLVLGEILSRYRERLRAPVAFWVRIGPDAPSRRRIFLGSRGRCVLGVWGDGVDPHAIRNVLAGPLEDAAYGPRPLDFELLRKLAGSRAAFGLLEEAQETPGGPPEAREERLRRALFEPSSTVFAPGLRHADRPRAWITVETTEGIESRDLLDRARSLAQGHRVEQAEAFPWDRINIHHPAIQVLIRLAKSRSEGPEIWPVAPWVTPSGIFTRSIGTPVAEWCVPRPPGLVVRAPTADALAAIESEIAELILRSVGALAEHSARSSRV